MSDLPPGAMAFFDQRKAECHNRLDDLWNQFGETLQKFDYDENKAVIVLLTQMFDAQKIEPLTITQLIELLGMAVTRMAPAEDRVR